MFVEPVDVSKLDREDLFELLDLDECSSSVYPECLECFVVNGKHVEICPYDGNEEKLLAAGFKRCEGH